MQVASPPGWGQGWVSIGLLAAGLAMLLAAGVADDDGPTLADLATVLAFPLYPLVGGFLVSRRPENVIGWIFLGVGLVPSQPLPRSDP